MIRKILIPCLAVMAAAQFAHADAVRVSNPTGNSAMAPGLVNAPEGSGAVLSWLERKGDQHVLKFSRFKNGSFGEAREIARGRDWFANWADTPAVHIRPDGTWIAHWLEKSARSTYAYDIRLVHSSDAGKSWSVPQTPHGDATPTEHGFVSYFDPGERTTGLVWLDGRATLANGPGAHAHTGFMTLRTAMIGADGAIGPEHQIDARVCDCCQTASGMTDEGPIVAYRNRTEDEIRDIAVSRHTAEGWSAPRIVHADGWQIGGCPVNGPSLIARGNQVVVAWFTMAGNTPKVRFAISTDAGASFAAPVTRSAGTALGRVQLIWTGDEFLLAWMEENGNGAILRIARYSMAGHLIGERELADVERGRVSGVPRIAAMGDRLLVAWTATGGADRNSGRRTQVMTSLVELPKAEKSR